MVATFSLSMHADYACRNSGACCSSGWAIPMEADRTAGVVRAIAGGRIRAARPWLLPATGAPPDIAGMLAQAPGGICVFHSTAASAHGPIRSDSPVGGAASRQSFCEIQQALGPAALPSACQHFPREVLTDGRGRFVTLSLYCPTAVDMLFAWSGPVTIVHGPAVGGDGAVGLDARGVLPPLLAPGILMDDEALSAWEAHVLRMLTADRADIPYADDALHQIAWHARLLSAWRPGPTSLSEAIRALDTAPPRMGTTIDWRDTCSLYDAALGAVPATLAWPRRPDDAERIWRVSMASQWAVQGPAINRFLCAHAFASWITYQGGGLAAHVQSLRQALAVLRIEVVRRCGEHGARMTASDLREGMRQSDLLLRHFADRSVLARGLGNRRA